MIELFYFFRKKNLRRCLTGSYIPLIASSSYVTLSTSCQKITQDIVIHSLLMLWKQFYVMTCLRFSKFVVISAVTLLKLLKQLPMTLLIIGCAA